MATEESESLLRAIERQKREIPAAARRHRARRVRLFGSVVRGEAHPGSDIDVLVDFDAGSSLFDLLHFQGELERLLGRSVDVVSTGGLKPRDEHILAEAIDL